MVRELQLRCGNGALGDQDGCGWEEELRGSVDGEVAYLDDHKLSGTAEEGRCADGSILNCAVNDRGADLQGMIYINNTETDIIVRTKY